VKILPSCYQLCGIRRKLDCFDTSTMRVQCCLQFVLFFVIEVGIIDLEDLGLSIDVTLGNELAIGGPIHTIDVALVIVFRVILKLMFHG